MAVQGDSYVDIFQMRKFWPREGKWPAQGHMVFKAEARTQVAYIWAQGSTYVTPQTLQLGSPFGMDVIVLQFPPRKDTCYPNSKATDITEKRGLGNEPGGAQQEPWHQQWGHNHAKYKGPPHPRADSVDAQHGKSHWGETSGIFHLPQLRQRCHGLKRQEDDSREEGEDDGEETVADGAHGSLKIAGKAPDDDSTTEQGDWILIDKDVGHQPVNCRGSWVRGLTVDCSKEGKVTTHLEKGE